MTDGRDELHDAVIDGKTEKVAELIRQGRDVNRRDTHGWTPLHFAAQQYAVKIAEMLLDAGAEVDPRNDHGNTPLWVAVMNSRGRGDLIVLLLKHGADREAKNNHGRSPADLAKTIANYDVAKFFKDQQK